MPVACYEVEHDLIQSANLKAFAISEFFRTGQSTMYQLELDAGKSVLAEYEHNLAIDCGILRETSQLSCGNDD